MDTILCFKSKLAEIIYLNEKKKTHNTYKEESLSHGFQNEKKKYNF